MASTNCPTTHNACNPGNLQRASFHQNFATVREKRAVGPSNVLLGAPQEGSTASQRTFAVQSEMERNSQHSQTGVPVRNKTVLDTGMTRMGLFENVQKEQVKSLNLRAPVLARPDDKLRDVVGKMREQNLGCAIIVDGDRKPVGMFTESMLTQLLAHRADAINDDVGKHSADHWPQVKLADPISAVLDALELKNIRFLSVVDDAGRIAGLTGQKGLMEYVAEHFPEVTVQRVGQKSSLDTREGA